MADCPDASPRLPYGWCDFEDVYRHWVRLLPADAVVVEVGSYLGQSAIVWGKLAQKRQSSLKLICVDPWQGLDESVMVSEDFKREQRKILRQFHGSMRPAFDQNLAAYGVQDWIDPRTATSVDAAATFAPESVDRVMIDGDHAAASVQADLDAWWPTLKPGGELVGHDDDWDSVHDTVRAWAAARQLQVFPLSKRCWRIVKPAPVTSWTVPPAVRTCLVAVCSNERTIYRETVKSLMALGWGLGVPKAMAAHGFADIAFAWFDKGHSVDVLREAAALYALRGQYSHLLYLDADMTWPSPDRDQPGLLEQILAHHDRGIVSGLYHMKGWPHKPVAFHASRWNAKDEVWDYVFDAPAAHGTALRSEELIGLGCALIPMQAFEVMPRPWFAYQRHKSTGLATVSEDVWFCEQAREAGVPIWLDPTLSCGHVSQHVVTDQDHFRAMFDVAHIEAGTVPELPSERARRKAKAS